MGWLTGNVCTSPGVLRAVALLHNQHPRHYFISSGRCNTGAIIHSATREKLLYSSRIHFLWIKSIRNIRLPKLTAIPKQLQHFINIAAGSFLTLKLKINRQQGAWLVVVDCYHLACSIFINHIPYEGCVFSNIINDVVRFAKALESWRRCALGLTVIEYCLNFVTRLYKSAAQRANSREIPPV